MSIIGGSVCLETRCAPRVVQWNSTHLESRIGLTMPKQSAGLLLYRRKNQTLEVFLVHPGGPFWAKKDQGACSIPKGEYSAPEEPLAAARREFQEETGFAIEGDFVGLGTIRQAGGKL